LSGKDSWPHSFDTDSKKKILEWVTWIVGVGTGLTTVIAVFLPEAFAKRVAFGIALILVAIFSAAFYYRRVLAARALPQEPTTPGEARAALRFLFPFEDGDELPGRAIEVQDLYTMTASTGFRFGVLCGETGCGKTSLLRAGLLPRLRAGGFLPLYVSNTGKDPQAALRAALFKTIPEAAPVPAEVDLRDLLRETARRQDKTLVLLFDQFEEFFIANRSLRSRTRFLRWVGECIRYTDLPAIFFFALRSDFLIRMRDFAAYVTEPTSVSAVYELRNFDIEQAKAVLRAAAQQDGIVFEAGLVDTIVGDLASDSIVRPAELQIVATRLKRRRIFNATGYEIAGGARGLLSFYITEEIGRSADAQTSRLILRLLCSQNGDARRPADLSLDDILRSIQNADVAPARERQEHVKIILDQFIDARILLRTEEGKYKLVHDYIVPYVQRATAEVETNIERSNRLVQRYVAEYKEDPKARIPWHALRAISRHASADVKGSEPARGLLRKSRRAIVFNVGRWSAAVLFVVLISTGLMTAKYDWREVALLHTREGLGPAPIDLFKSLAFSPSGELLAAVGSYAKVGEIQLWNVRTRKLLPLEPVGALFPDFNSAVFSPDEKFLVSGDRFGNVWLSDLNTGRSEMLSDQRFERRPPCGVSSLTFTPDESILASGDECGTIQLWDVSKRQSLALLINEAGPVNSLVFSPDGAQLVSVYKVSSPGSAYYQSKLWDIDKRASTAMSNIKGRVFSVTFGPDGNPWALSVVRESAQLWDLRTGEYLETAVSNPAGAFPQKSNLLASALNESESVRGHANLAILSSDAGMIASGSQDGTVRLWNAGAADPYWVFSSEDAADVMIFSTDRRRLAVASWYYIKLYERALWIWAVRIPGNW
jgi:hypothetical protein